jgi:acetoin utilization deacetylase AcuC-like enzyme
LTVLIAYDRRMHDLGYPPLKERVEPAFRHLQAKGLLTEPGVRVVEPEPIALELVSRVHTPRHISDVEGSGYLEVALLSTGGVLEASRAVVSGEADNAFCFVGAAGHHASREGFWGFCFINDIGVAGCHLLDEGLAERLAIVDIDPHFGDGTRDVFGGDERVLHLNFSGGYGERGAWGETNVDIALPYDATDDVFIEQAERALEKAVEFDPDILYVVFGYDSHAEDYGAFYLSLDAYPRFAVAVRERFPAGVCYVLSGGAQVEIGKRAIASVVEVLLGS